MFLSGEYKGGRLDLKGKSEAFEVVVVHAEV